MRVICAERHFPERMPCADIQCPRTSQEAARVVDKEEIMQIQMQMKPEEMLSNPPLSSADELKQHHNLDLGNGMLGTVG